MSVITDGHKVLTGCLKSEGSCWRSFWLQVAVYHMFIYEGTVIGKETFIHSQEELMSWIVVIQRLEDLAANVPALTMLSVEH